MSALAASILSWRISGDEDLADPIKELILVRLLSTEGVSLDTVVCFLLTEGNCDKSVDRDLETELPC